MCVRPSQPLRMPITLQPISVARYTTDLMTEFRPGTSPPPVRIPIRFIAMLTPGGIESRKDGPRADDRAAASTAHEYVPRAPLTPHHSRGADDPPGAGDRVGLGQ